MPPKVKTDRNCIVNAAFEVAKSEGLAAVTAQSVSAVLKTSVAPIFREFQTIEELRIAAAEKNNEFHTQYIQNYPLVGSEFLTYGIAYIHFAQEYPQLFEMIIQPGCHSMREQLTDSIAFAVNSAGKQSGLSAERAKDLFSNIWIYTHGIACLVYRGSIVMTEEEEKNLLINAFGAFNEHYKKLLGKVDLVGKTNERNLFEEVSQWQK